MNVNDLADYQDDGRCYSCGAAWIAGSCPKCGEIDGVVIAAWYADPRVQQAIAAGDESWRERLIAENYKPHADNWTEPKAVVYESEWGLQAYRYCWNQPEVDKWLASARRCGYDPFLLSVEEVRKREHEDRAFQVEKARDLIRSRQARKRAALDELREVVR